MSGEAEANLPTRDLARVVERAVERALRRERERRLEYWYGMARFAFWPIAILAAFWAICAAVIEMGIVGWLFALGSVAALIRNTRLKTPALQAWG
jgi:hypothetical protein